MKIAMLSLSDAHEIKISINIFYLILIFVITYAILITI